MQEFKLPDLGEGMQEAEIRRWLVKPGDVVKIDQPMVEVETDKAVVEIPSPVAARVADLHVAEGKVARLGAVLVTFDSPTNPPAPRAVPSIAILNSSANNTQKDVPAASFSPTASSAGAASEAKQRVLAAPAVRKRAFELGIDLAKVRSSQSHGRITLDDLLAYAENTKNGAEVQSATNGASSLSQAQVVLEEHPVPATAATTEERKPLVGLRRRIAERMELSWRTVPHASAFDELDGTELAALRQILKPVAEQRGVRLTYLPLLVKLLLPALKEFPIFNASLDEGTREIIYKYSYHVGIAADTPEGLLVPVLRNADQLSLIQLAQQLEHLIAGAQNRTLSIPEVAGSTFTLNNIGSFGGSSGTPIINYPEVAILAIGRLQEKAVVRNGSIVVRTMMPLALSFDHRLIDGALAGRFLARFKELVEHPQQLMLDMV